MDVFLQSDSRGSVYQSSFMDENIQQSSLPPEIEEGNVEYKLHLINPSPDRFQHLVTQLKWRLAEGFGEALYEIGISDNGQVKGLTQSDLNASINTLRRMGNELNAEVSIVREKYVDEIEKSRKVAEVLVRRKSSNENHFLEIRIAIIGPVEAGKSTLVGVLSQGELDNGKGKTRLNLLRHRHEIESGRTSSISRQIIGFDQKGQLVNFASTNISSWEQICDVSSKVISFLDTCGHPKYQRTTISGLTGRAIHYVCLIVNANAGIVSDITRDHIGIAVALKVPLMVVITKIDVTSSSQLLKTLSSLFSLLKSPGVKRLPVVMENEDDVVVSVSSFVSSSIAPIFMTSSVTGENVHLLHKFFNLLPKPAFTSTSQSVEYQIEEIYDISEVGTVVGGLALAGTVVPNKTYYVGPDKGRFERVMIKSIQRQRCDVGSLSSGQAGTFAITFLDSFGTKKRRREAPFSPKLTANDVFVLRKGQVIVEDVKPENVCWEFDAEVTVLYHESVMGVLMHGNVYIGTTRQAAKVIKIQHEKEEDFQGLRTGERGKVRLRFLNEPEWVNAGSTVVFRDGKNKCVGKVVGV